MLGIKIVSPMIRFLRRHWIALLAIVLLQVLLCLTEASGAIHCNHSTSDCAPWTWFFAFLVNYPFSIAIDQLSAILVGPFVIEHYDWSVAITFVLYVVGGSFWGFMIVLGVQWCWRVLVEK